MRIGRCLVMRAPSSILRQFVSKPAIARSKMLEESVVFHSVNSILEIFNQRKFESTAGVTKLVKTYKELLEKVRNEKIQKNYPLIVLEGLDGSGKSTLSKKLAKKVGAEFYSTPPKSLGADMRALFDNNKVLRTAFYALGNYIGALEMTFMLQNAPVIVDRFWHSTAAYAIAQAVQDQPEAFQMPQKGDKIYNWPKDLLKPDMILLLGVSEEERLKRQSNRTVVTAQEDLLKSNTMFRENVLTAYKHMDNPQIIFMNGDKSFMKVLHDLINKVTPLLK